MDFGFVSHILHNFTVCIIDAYIINKKQTLLPKDVSEF